MEFVEHLDALASAEGFPFLGIAKASDNDQMPNLREWLKQGYHGEMSYLETRYEAYAHPRHVLDNCRSVIMLGMPYAANPKTRQNKSIHPIPLEPKPLAVGNGIAPESQLGNYASGSVDYHDYIRGRLNSITKQLTLIEPKASWRGVVDTAPLMERDYARKAGLGWIGKNTLLLNREWGSYFFLAAILTDLDLPAHQTYSTDHCGTCTACLDACPTDAFVQAHVMDASKCISYLTIEFRGSIPEPLRPKMQNWIFGCDVCQMVCPWNRKRNTEHANVFEPENLSQKQSLSHWLTISEEEFRILYKKRPFWRTKLNGMRRNALIAAANTRRLDLVPSIKVLCESQEEIVAETARWALSELTT